MAYEEDREALASGEWAGFEPIREVFQQSNEKWTALCRKQEHETALAAAELGYRLCQLGHPLDYVLSKVEQIYGQIYGKR